MLLRAWKRRVWGWVRRWWRCTVWLIAGYERLVCRWMEWEQVWCERWKSTESRVRDGATLWHSWLCVCVAAKQCTTWQPCGFKCSTDSFSFSFFFSFWNYMCLEFTPTKNDLEIVTEQHQCNRNLNWQVFFLLLASHNDISETSPFTPTPTIWPSFNHTRYGNRRSRLGVNQHHFPLDWLLVIYHFLLGWLLDKGTERKGNKNSLFYSILFYFFHSLVGMQWYRVSRPMLGLSWVELGLSELCSSTLVLTPISDIDSLPMFKSRLQTHLFKIGYSV